MAPPAHKKRNVSDIVNEIKGKLAHANPLKRKRDEDEESHHGDEHSDEAVETDYPLSQLDVEKSPVDNDSEDEQPKKKFKAKAPIAPKKKTPASPSTLSSMFAFKNVMRGMGKLPVGTLASM